MTDEQKEKRIDYQKEYRRNMTDEQKSKTERLSKGIFKKHE